MNITTLRSFSLPLLAVLCSLVNSPGQTLGPYSVVLAWEASGSSDGSGPDPSVTGYAVYWGTAPGQYTETLTLNNVLTCSVSGLLPGVTYYFAATAHDAIGLESDYSNEVSYRKDDSAVLRIERTAPGTFQLSIAGVAGRSYALECSPDLQTWTTIATVTADEQGSASFTDTPPAGLPQRFYRTRDDSQAAR